MSAGFWTVTAVALMLVIVPSTWAFLHCVRRGGWRRCWALVLLAVLIALGCSQPYDALDWDVSLVQLYGVWGFLFCFGAIVYWLLSLGQHWRKSQ